MTIEDDQHELSESQSEYLPLREGTERKKERERKRDRDREREK